MSNFRKNPDFGRKIAISVKIFENLDFWWRFTKHLDFGQKFRIISILVKIGENLKFSQNLRNISILVQITENLDVGQNFLKNLDWSQNFRNISILAEI